MINDLLLKGPIRVACLCDLIVKYADSFEGEQAVELGTRNWLHGDLVWVSVNRVAVCSHNHLQVWDISSNTPVQCFHDRRLTVKNPLAIGTKLMASSYERVHMWDINTGRYELTMTFNASVNAMVALDNERVVMICVDTSMHLWNVMTGFHEQTFCTWHISLMSLVAIRKNCFATGSIGGCIRVWDPERPEFTNELFGHVGSVVSLVRLCDTMFASGSLDCTVRVWDLESGTCSMVIVAHEEPLYSLACLDAFTVVSCAQGDHYVRAWRVDTGAPAWAIKHNHPTRLAAGWNKLAVCETPGEVRGKVLVWH